MKKLFSILAVLLFALPGWGATIYVKDDPNNSGTKVCYKADGWADATCSDGTGNKNLQQAHVAAGENGTLIIAAGTYVGTQIYTGAPYSSFSTGAAGVHTRAAYATDPLDNGVSRAGEVILNGNNAAFSLLTFTHANCVYSDLTLSMPGNGYAAIVTRDNKFPVFNRIRLIRGNGMGYAIAPSSDVAIDDSITFNNVYADNVSLGSCSRFGTATYNYGIYKRLGYSPINGNATFNNGLFIDAPRGLFYNSQNYAVAVTFNNPIFYNNITTVGTPLHVLSNTQALPVWTVNNGILLNHPNSSDSYGYNNIVINNSTRNKDPLFVGNKYPAVLSFASDDTGNVDWIYDTVIPLLEARGYRITFAAYNGWTAGQLVKMQDMVARGHEIASHGRSHAIVSRKDVFKLFRTGYACSKPYSGNTLTCTDGVSSNVYDLTDAAYDTIGELRDAMDADGYTVGAVTSNYTLIPSVLLGFLPEGTPINSLDTNGIYIYIRVSAPYTITGAVGETIEVANGVITTSAPHTYTLANYSTVTALRTALLADGYTVPVVAGGYDGFPAVFADVPAGTSIAAPLPLVSDSDAVRTYNILGSIADLAAVGIPVTTYVCPIDVTSYDLQKWLYDNGVVGARGGVTGSYSISSANAYNILDTGSGWVKTTTNCVASGESEANCIKRNMIARIAYMKGAGRFGVVLAHNEAELNAAQWTAMLDAVAQSGVSVMTLRDLATFIKTYNPSDDLATTDNMTYTRTLVDGSDYHLKSGSPAINAGVPIDGLTTDADGKPIAGKPDIGAYERRGKILQ